MRVIAGESRGRKLVAPEGRDTRPIGDRAKEGIFNMLGGLVDFDGIQVVDLFAGSGSFGIECLSRGASHVTFVEQGRPAQAAIAKNLEKLDLTAKATTLRGSVESVISTLQPVELAFLDPPYAVDMWSELLATVDASVVVGHAGFEIPLSSGWVEQKRRTYGRSHIVIAERETSLS